MLLLLPGIFIGPCPHLLDRAERARVARGELVLRNDDLDAVRFRLDFVEAMLEDLRWLGLTWTEGPDIGGPHAPYNQSQRRSYYRAALEKLHAAGLIFPCIRSRRDVLEAIGAPHENVSDDEPVYPREFVRHLKIHSLRWASRSQLTGGFVCRMTR